MVKGVFSSVSSSPFRSYRKAWRDFTTFRFKSLAIGCERSSSIDHVLQYLANLYQLGRTPKTIKIHAAAISFFSKILFALDPCADFLVRKALEGWHRMQPIRKCGRRLLMISCAGFMPN